MLVLLSVGAVTACSSTKSDDDSDDGGAGAEGGTGGSIATGGSAPSGGVGGSGGMEPVAGGAGSGGSAGSSGVGGSHDGLAGRPAVTFAGASGASPSSGGFRGSSMGEAGMAGEDHGPGCEGDDECDPGKICSKKKCVAGCTEAHPCDGAKSCCDGACVDFQSDPLNCGGCGNVCEAPSHSAATCVTATCGSACAGDYVDCDGDAANGCEWDSDFGGECVCTPGDTQPCYYGPADTLGVAPCKAGTRTCIASGTSWGICEGSITPVAEICDNGIDEDCSGVADEDAPDVDGDGWRACDGDCCDSGGCASEPALVNPGALEAPDDGVDNDCNGMTDDVPVTDCSTAAKFTGVTGSDVAKAMDLCQTTSASAPLAARTWGLVSATQILADGSTPIAANAQDKQSAVVTDFGTVIVPTRNATLGIISTGVARDAGDPGWASTSTSIGSTIAFPGAPPLSTYLAAHAGNLEPGECAGTTCATGTGANDSIGIRLVIRAPTNARGFSYDFRFFSAEYQIYQCTSFNDYYLALLTSEAEGIPADHNISFDSLSNPVSVNNGFFEVCGGNGQDCGTCPGGTAALAGTGFDSVSGGATEWLTTDAPIVPGETFTLDLLIFDVSDHALDSLVILDNFRWSLEPVEVGTHQ
jgi:hypothetical protein